jgi:hypothetical protein
MKLKISNQSRANKAISITIKLALTLMISQVVLLRRLVQRRRRKRRRRELKKIIWMICRLKRVS